MKAAKDFLLSVPGIALSVLPVGACPACWPVYAGVVSALGLTVLLQRAYLIPITALFLLIAVGTLLLKRRRGFWPFAVGLAAAATILIGKFALETDPVTYAGVGLLVLASFCNAWPRRVAAPCPRCAPSVSEFIQLSATEKTTV